MDYVTADSQLQGRNRLRRKVGNNTYLERRPSHETGQVDEPSAQGPIALRLHDTDVVTWYADGRIELNTGGWLTFTTKARINEFISGYYISQERGVWYVTQYANSKYQTLGVFADGLTIHADGTITGMSPLDDAKEKNKLRRRVALFAKHYIAAFKDGKVPAPSNGDCFYCVMRTVDTGKTLGEAFSDKDHIISHMDESYFVPSLLSRAFETMPHSPAMGWALAKAWGSDKTLPVPEFVYDQLQKSLSRYMLRQLGQAA